MKKIRLIIFKIKRFLWLIPVFIVRILFSKKHFKVPLNKRLYYAFNGGFTADQIALYDLNKQTQKEYLSEFDWYKSRKINYPNSYMLNNKLICEKMIEKFIKTPKTIIKCEKGVIRNKDDKETTIDEAISLLKKEKSTFFKPISVGKGIGVFRIDFSNNEFSVNFEKLAEVEIKKILSENDNYFISTCIRQAKYLDNIYNKASNTIRIITIRDEGDIKIPFAVQRIGCKKTIPVDNGSKGGLVAKIDLETGILSKAKSIQNKKEYSKHPDSNKKIEGVKVPNWNQIKNKMIKLAENLPEFKFVAWDVLPTDDDIYVIEANNSSGVNIIQVFGGQRNNVLGDFYRKEKIIK